MIELGSHAGIGLKSNIRIAQRAVDSDNSDPNAPLIEAFTALVLIIAPSMTRFLLGTNASGAALLIARIAGCGLLLIGIACWPRIEATVPRLRAMLVYNLLATVYLGYIWFGSESVGKLLLPAIAVHAVPAILFIGVSFKH